MFGRNILLRDPKFSISRVPHREKRHILMWTISQRSGTFSAIFRQASYDGVRFQASFDHFRSVNWAEDCVSVKTREIKIHVYDKRQT